MTTKNIKKIEIKEEEGKTRKVSQSDYESKIIELAKTGLTAEKIGEALRKQKIHPREFNGKISKILKKEKLYTNPDIQNIGDKLEKLKTHCKKNHQDKRAKRDKERIFAQNRKLKMYHQLE